MVTPLTALGRQQAHRYEALGGKAQFLDPSSDIWIGSPELISHERTLQALRHWRPDFLVVDECHCLWEWGEDFRPAFASIPSWVNRFGIRHSLWLTATLPTDARKALKSQLPESLEEIGEFELPTELSLQVVKVPWPDRPHALLRWVSRMKGSGIIFVPTRQATHRLTRLLCDRGIRAIPYHAGLSIEERRLTERELESGTAQVLVATSAFGMGMDYACLQWALIWQAPMTLLSLAQMIGRVGRAGAAGRAFIFWDIEDYRLLQWSIRGSQRRQLELNWVFDFLKSPACRRRHLATYFGHPKSLDSCGRCDRCVD